MRRSCLRSWARPRYMAPEQVEVGKVTYDPVDTDPVDVAR